MCRLTENNGEIKQFCRKLDVLPKLWDVKTAHAMGKIAEAQKINAAVDWIRADVNRFCLDFILLDIVQVKIVDAHAKILMPFPKKSIL